MKFSVIYSFDCPAIYSVAQFMPPGSQMRRRRHKLWEVTEGDSEYGLSHLGGEWERGKHRKLCAILSREEFDAFVEHCDLRASRTETMGSIGTPGFGIFWAPAISFDCSSGYANAYVTPIPDVERVRPSGDDSREARIWERVRLAVIRTYE